MKLVCRRAVGSAALILLRAELACIFSCLSQMGVQTEKGHYKLNQIYFQRSALSKKKVLAPNMSAVAPCALQLVLVDTTMMHSLTPSTCVVQQHA
jgi:hypothetical protein